MDPSFHDSPIFSRTLPVSNWGEALLRDLLHIDSSSLNLAGVQQCQERVAHELRELGFGVELRPSPDTYAPLLLAERPDKRKDFVTLVFHADTVLPGNTVEVLDSGLKWRASGAIDNKGGIAVALTGLKAYLEKTTKSGLSLRVVSSPNEEVGSIHWTPLFGQLAQTSWMALGFEPALDDGDIIHARRGNRWYQIRVEGREAHAGRSYGEHVNAAHELAWKIHRMQKLTNYRRHRSVNVGAIQGGRDRFNVVCGHAEAKLDVRFVSFRDREKLHSRIESILNRKKHPSVCGRYVPTTTYEILDDCPPFSPRFMSRKWIRRYSDCIAKIEKKAPASRMAGGAGDVNYFSRPETIVLDGLGAIGGGMHTVDEFVHLSSIQSRAQALALFLQSLN